MRVICKCSHQLIKANASVETIQLELGVHSKRLGRVRASRHAYLHNLALLLRWWWKLYNEPDALWTGFVSKIKWQGFFSLGPMLWSKFGSFFWNQLVGLKDLFNWSTLWIVGNGYSISFWYDQWGPSPLVPTSSRQQLHALSLKDALSQYHSSRQQQQLPESHPPPALTDADDQLVWKWSTNGRYSAKLIYSVMFGGGLVDWRFKGIWKFSIPPSTKVFLFLPWIYYSNWG